MNETPAKDQGAARLARIEDSLDRDVLKGVAATPGGVLTVSTYNQLLDLAKVMATAKSAIPAHLQTNLGDCLAIWDMAQNTGLQAYRLARHSYLVNGMLAFESIVLRALIRKFAPIQGHMRFNYEGDGDERRCTVTAIPTGETEALTYTSPPLGKITPKRSPLWTSDPDQQLAYFSSARFTRLHFPEVLLGVYDRDEAADMHIGPENAKDITPVGLMDRLPGRMENAGLQPTGVEQALDIPDAAWKAAAQRAGWAFDEPSGEYRLNDKGEGSDEVLAGTLSWRAVCEYGSLHPTAEDIAAATAPPAATEKRRARKKGKDAPQEPTEGKAAVEPSQGQQASVSEAPSVSASFKPATSIEYQVWHKAWLAAEGNTGRIETRWVAEETLRKECKVSPRERKAMEEANAARIKALKG